MNNTNQVRRHNTMNVRNRTKLIEILSLLLIIQLTTLCQNVVCKHRNKTNSGGIKAVKSKNISEIEGESRIIGGILEKDIPDFLGTAWLPKGYRPDIRHAGHAIGMGGNNFLVHQDTAWEVQKSPVPPIAQVDVDSYLRLPVVDAILKRPSYAIPGPKEFNTETFSPENHGSRIEHVKNVGKSQFALFKDGHPAAEANFAAPKLEHNKTEFGKDCKAYGWGSYPTSQGQRAAETKYFVHLPVVTNRCNDQGDCELLADNYPYASGFCQDVGDKGMPILCGPEKKLTYLVTGDSKDNLGCSRKFNAFHVPHMIDELKEAIQESKDSEPPPHTSIFG